MLSINPRFSMYTSKFIAVFTHFAIGHGKLSLSLSHRLLKQQLCTVLEWKERVSVQNRLSRIQCEGGCIVLLVITPHRHGDGASSPTCHVHGCIYRGGSL